MGNVIKLEVVHKSGKCEFKEGSRQKPLAMEHLAWDRLLGALQMQSRCFHCVCFCFTGWRERGLAKEESHRLFFLAPRLCSFNHIMLVLRKRWHWLGWEKHGGLVHRSIIPGRDVAWELKGCASWRWVTGTVFLVVRQYASQADKPERTGVCPDPAWLKCKIQEDYS